MWWYLLRKKQKKFLTSNKKLGMIVELRKAEVRASRLATNVVWLYGLSFSNEILSCSAGLRYQVRSCFSRILN